MPELEITVQGTPNPHAAKFNLGLDAIGSGSRSYFTAEDAVGDALAESLFRIEGVRALFMVDDFITVTKTDDAEWSDLVERIEDVIRSELDRG